jgi:ABC-2 type transport system ATP-binding protein
MIEACGLTKRYGDTLAVDDLSFEVRPGRVTGFLGPNTSLAAVPQRHTLLAAKAAVVALVALIAGTARRSGVSFQPSLTRRRPSQAGRCPDLRSCWWTLEG